MNNVPVYTQYNDETKNTTIEHGYFGWGDDEI